MKTLLSALFAAAVISSCAPMTPQARIERNPEKFAALPKSQQELVEKGLISRGMRPDAVYLAWGGPDRTFDGSKDSRSTQRWDYAGTRPVYTTNYFGGFGYNGYGPYGYSGLGLGFGPDVAYIPYRVASVWFVDDRVDAWERVR